MRDFYYSAGEGERRRWSDMVRLGFISAGGGRRGFLDPWPLRQRELRHEASRFVDFAATFGGLRGRVGGRRRPALRLSMQAAMSQTSLEITSCSKAFVRDLTDGQQVESPFVVRDRARRQKRNGESFLK